MAILGMHYMALRTNIVHASDFKCMRDETRHFC